MSGTQDNRRAPDELLVFHHPDDEEHVGAVRGAMARSGVPTVSIEEATARSKDRDADIRACVERACGVLIVTSISTERNPAGFVKDLGVALDAVSLRRDPVGIGIARLHDCEAPFEFSGPVQVIDLFGEPKAALIRLIDLSRRWSERAHKHHDQRKQLAQSTAQGDEDSGSEAEGEAAPPVERVRPPGDLPVLFEPSELDIYVKKDTLESFIFHGKVIDYNIKRVVLDPDEHWMIVEMKDGRRLDLGVAIQWLVRPYLMRSSEITICRTENGQSRDGVVVPLHVRGRDDGAGAKGAAIGRFVRGFLSALGGRS